ncbi:MAG: DUF6756 family protein [Bacteroidota bacterium]
MEKLIEEINSVIVRNELDFTLLERIEAGDIYDKLNQSFPINYNQRWLWENENISLRFSYEEGNDWSSALGEALNDFDDKILFIPTDDEFFPWKIFEGEKRQLMELLEDLYYFEYFVTDRSFQKIVFDNHHNEIIVMKCIT